MCYQPTLTLIDVSWIHIKPIVAPHGGGGGTSCFLLSPKASCFSFILSESNLLFKDVSSNVDCRLGALNRSRFVNLADMLDPGTSGIGGLNHLLQEKGAGEGEQHHGSSRLLFYSQFFLAALAP